MALTRLRIEITRFESGVLRAKKVGIVSPRPRGGTQVKQARERRPLPPEIESGPFKKITRH